MEKPSPKGETKRKHVTTACDACRESKVKCNGATPACSSCAGKGKECRYQAREDKRKLSLRIAVELLSKRVQQLSQCLTDNDLEIPSMLPEDDKTLSGILYALGLAQRPPSQAEPDGATQASPAAQDLDRRTQSPEDTAAPVPAIPSTHQPRDAGGTPLPAMQGLLELANAAGDIGGIVNSQAGWDWNMAAESMPQGQIMQRGYVPTDPALSGFFGSVSTPPKQQPLLGGVLSCPPLELDDGISTSESADTLVDQLSDRVGTLHIRPGGHFRFYGSTSNFNLLQLPATDISMNVHRTIRNDGVEHLERLGVNKEVPAEIEDHLMNLYFTWQDPSFHAVDRKMFEEARVIWRDKKEDTSYYSEALRNAICALGAAFDARHHPAFVTFPRSLADFFADRAKALLEIELDSPCVATIQALVLLSAHDIGCGRDARGWLFSGMAMRLSFNLALHHDLEPYIAKGVVTAAEADLRRTVFWAAFVVEHVWSFYLGQPFRMSTKGVSLDKPRLKNRSAVLGQWTPYVSPTITQTFTPMAGSVEEVFRCQVLLFDVIAPLSDTLYASATTPKSTLQEINAQIVTKLLSWKEELPVELRVDFNDHETTYLPHVILLHMQYYQSLIYAHRPWMSKVHIQPQPPQGPGANHARKTCMDSASAIALLLRLYEERYTLRRINIQAVAITFSAALLLVFATVCHDQREREDEVLADLSVCLRALDELAPSWDTAKRAREFLISLQRHWERQVKASSMATARDDASSTHSGFSNPRKRHRESIRSSDEGRPVRFREGMMASMQREHWSDGGGIAINSGMDLDFDWLLTTSMEDMLGTWGNSFPVPSSTVILE